MNKLVLFSIKEIIKFCLAKFVNNIAKNTSYKTLDFIDDMQKQGHSFKKKGKGIIINLTEINPLRRYYLRRNTSDIELYNQIVVKEEYRGLIELIEKQKNTKNIKSIIDLGANIGLASLYFNNYFKEACIIAVEPEASNFSSIQTNIKINGIKAITPLNKAIWHENTTLEICGDFRDKKEWSFSTVNATEKSKCTVQAITIKEILKKFSIKTIDILKIDIEGAERYLFAYEDCMNTFLKCTKYLAIEIHDEFNIRDKIYSKLKEYKFEFFKSGETTIAYNLKLVN